MNPLERFARWFTRPPRAQRIELALARIETALSFQGFTLQKLKRQGEQMATDLSAVEQATSRVEQAVDRTVEELRDLASKLLAPDGAEQIAAVAGRLNVLADKLNTTVDEVDTDGSSPAAVA